MTPTTLVNVDLCLGKLKAEVKESAHVTIKTALLRMAIKAIEQQKAQIEALERVQTEYIGLAVAVPSEEARGE